MSLRKMKNKNRRGMEEDDERENGGWMRNEYRREWERRKGKGKGGGGGEEEGG